MLERRSNVFFLTGGLLPEFVSETEWLELTNKVPHGSPFHLILTIAEAWFDKMEELGVEKYNQAFHEINNIHGLSALSAGDLAEVMVIAIQYWKQGSRLSECLTYLEHRLVTENIVSKMSKLSQIAHDQGQRQLYGQ